MILETYADGSRLERDDTDAWQCNMRHALLSADDEVIYRGPEWRARLVASHRIA